MCTDPGAVGRSTSRDMHGWACKDGPADAREPCPGRFHRTGPVSRWNILAPVEDLPAGADSCRPKAVLGFHPLRLQGVRAREVLLFGGRYHGHARPWEHSAGAEVRLFKATFAVDHISRPESSVYSVSVSGMRGIITLYSRQHIVRMMRFFREVKSHKVITGSHHLSRHQVHTPQSRASAVRPKLLKEKIGAT